MKSGDKVRLKVDLPLSVGGIMPAGSVGLVRECCAAHDPNSNVGMPKVQKECQGPLLYAVRFDGGYQQGNVFPLAIIYHDVWVNEFDLEMVVPSIVTIDWSCL